MQTGRCCEICSMISHHLPLMSWMYNMDIYIYIDTPKPRIFSDYIQTLFLCIPSQRSREYSTLEMWRSQFMSHPIVPPRNIGNHILYRNHNKLKLNFKAYFFHGLSFDPWGRAFIPNQGFTTGVIHGNPVRSHAGNVDGSPSRRGGDTWGLLAESFWQTQGPTRR